MNATTTKLQVWWKRTRHESDLYAAGASNATLGFILHAFAGPRERTRFVNGRGFVSGFDQSVLDELIARGYDVTTLRFQVRGYKHLWIVPGQILQHRTTRAWVRVHHVRWERGVGRVMLVPYIPSERVAAFDEHVKDVARRLPYVPIVDVERDYTCFDHPCSWLSREARALLRPWCQMCGRIRERQEGMLVCPKGCGQNALVEALIDRGSGA
jgi:hypothetical protein